MMESRRVVGRSDGRNDVGRSNERSGVATLPLLAASVFLSMSVVGFGLSVVPLFVHNRLD